MIDGLTSKECCLCQACAAVCPVDAISFRYEEATFLYPRIDYTICIQCQACEKACPAMHGITYVPSIYSCEARNKNSGIIKSSSSGGTFSALANVVLRSGGVVVGAAFQEDWSVKHIFVEREEDVYLLRGSKYAQSDLTECFEHIQQYLEDGRRVLFSGSPCQCAALKVNYGGRYKDNLILVDFVCHGVLSCKLFQEYIEYLEEKNRSKIRSFQFRNKKYGWINSGPEITFENGKVRNWPLYEDMYMQGYFQEICMKESCYNCQYKNYHSGSDITLGDFWGAEILDPEFYCIDGVSAVFIQTRSGFKLFQSAQKELEYKTQGIDVLTRYNKGLFYPFKAGEKRGEFLQRIDTEPAISVLRDITLLRKIERIKRIYRRFRRAFLQMQSNDGK